MHFSSVTYINQDEIELINNFVQCDLVFIIYEKRTVGALVLSRVLKIIIMCPIDYLIQNLELVVG